MGSSAAALKHPPGQRVQNTFSGRVASQDADELAALISLLQAEGVKRYGEIGAREGDTFYAVMNALPAGSAGTAVDFPGGAWGHKSTRQKLERCVAALRAEGYKAGAMFGDSRAPATIQQFRGRGPYDAILIDGDHRLEGVTADWVNYCTVGRIVAFHDIVGAGQKDRAGNRVDVHKLWATIRASGLRTEEFVSTGSAMGIGVVWTK